jgi:hypothetical protein
MSRIALIATLITVAVTPAAASAATRIPAPAPAGVKVAPQQSPQRLEAGDAGIDGYDDEKCGNLAKDYNVAIEYMDTATTARDVRYFANLAIGIRDQLESNCMTVEDPEQA